MRLSLFLNNALHSSVSPCYGGGRFTPLKISIRIADEISTKLPVTYLKQAPLWGAVLHHFSFETPTLGGVLSEDGDTFSAFEMRKGVNLRRYK